MANSFNVAILKSIFLGFRKVFRKVRTNFQSEFPPAARPGLHQRAHGHAGGAQQGWLHAHQLQL